MGSIIEILWIIRVRVSSSTLDPDTWTNTIQDMKASNVIRSSSRTGTICIDGLRFSLDALADTRRARCNYNLSDFEVKYGDYYMESLQLGADAGILASTASMMRRVRKP